MGSFASTCAVSGIPLEVGDPVRWYLLTENPYDDNLVCYSHDMWFPRSWPVRATYNDYGSIEKYDLKCPSIVSIVEALKHDMIERGMGDNSCHDVPTARGMSFEATLEAVWEKRIQVSRDVDTLTFMNPEMEALMKRGRDRRAADNETVEPKRLRGYPTLRGVEDTLKNAGHGIVTAEPSTNTHAGAAYMVDELEPGMCRVRINGFGEDASKLEAILPLLQEEYAAAVTIGSGSYANSAEIRVMPKVMKRERDEYVSWGRETSREKSLCVYQGMIHGDVWDELMKMKVGKGWDEKVKVGFDEYRVDAQKQWDESEKRKSSSLGDMLARLGGGEHDTYVGSLVSKSVIPFTVGLSEHWKIATGQKPEKFTAKQVDEFLSDVAGFSLLHAILPTVRYWWRPSFTCGPQFGEHKKHAEIFSAFRKATMAAKKRRKW
jgi:hypothetical protein